MTGDIQEVLGPEGVKRAWSQLYDMFIQPELDKREIGFEIVERVLVLLPKDGSPIVQFNDEAAFTYRLKDPQPRFAGDKVKYEDIRDIEAVLPPEVDGCHVAFFYAWRGRVGINLTFDFRPNNPGFVEDNHVLAEALSFQLIYAVYASSARRVCGA